MQRIEALLFMRFPSDIALCDQTGRSLKKNGVLARAALRASRNAGWRAGPTRLATNSRNASWLVTRRSIDRRSCSRISAACSSPLSRCMCLRARVLAISNKSRFSRVCSRANASVASLTATTISDGAPLRVMKPSIADSPQSGAQVFGAKEFRQ